MTLLRSSISRFKVNLLQYFAFIQKASSGITKRKIKVYLVNHIFIWEAKEIKSDNLRQKTHQKSILNQCRYMEKYTNRDKRMIFKFTLNLLIEDLNKVNPYFIILYYIIFKCPRYLIYIKYSRFMGDTVHARISCLKISLYPASVGIYLAG